MLEKKEKEREAYDQYLKEKDEVEKVMKTMLESERSYMQLREQKKKQAFEDMKVQISLKE